ncbi:hypothetical protein HanXRQr2_Chr05g0230791 [Helianthus annuus]|uniref:Uncharacterized protein n=1 Tax=Helianthus annuus TaxID=4232 RepID=A0A9K3NPZ5_HELAN|nr:hypothetical protein HanXRQr2_Chr05g0230791 [Helianthus annuus]KAJ0923950.1 hypothetical protein HanPSC8_Chr05g0222621 [Helianthus annuus]
MITTLLPIHYFSKLYLFPNWASGRNGATIIRPRTRIPFRNFFFIFSFFQTIIWARGDNRRFGLCGG